MGNYKYLFGPVPSRRFGRFLGVDLTPYEVSKYLGNLMRADQIRAERKKTTVYYAATSNKGKSNNELRRSAGGRGNE